MYIWIVIAVLLLPVGNVLATDNGLFTEKGYVKGQSARPAINEDFAPDKSCMFDTFQLKCIPGSEQECPEGFGSGDPETCFFMNPGGCPEDYHSTDGDETGQCYRNSDNCKEGSSNKQRRRRVKLLFTNR